MTPFPIRGRRTEAKVSEGDRRVVEAGPLTYMIHPGEDPLPTTVCAVVPLVDEQAVLWVEVYVRPAPTMQRQFDGSRVLKDRPERLLGVFRADWRPSESAVWTRGEVFEVVVGPLGLSSTARPIIGEMLRGLVDAVVQRGGPLTGPVDGPAAAAAFDARARAAAPREFAALAAATRILTSTGEETDDADQADIH